MLLAAVRAVCLRSFMSATLVARNELSHCASFPVCVTIMLDEMASYNVSHGLLRACPGVGRDSRYSVYGTREKQHASARDTRDREYRLPSWRIWGESRDRPKCPQLRETCALSCVVSRRLLVSRRTTHDCGPAAAWRTLSVSPTRMSAGAGQRERESVSLQYSTACRDLVCSGFNILMTLCFMSQVLGVW